jgi:hypothetical protein
MIGFHPGYLHENQGGKMENRKSKTFFVLLTLIATILACNMPSPTAATATAPAATQAPAATEAAAAPPTEPPIQHVVIPIDLPADRSSHAGDYDSSATASKKTAAGGDRFTFERFERPFNAISMDVYFPQLDILDTFVYQDKTWIYGKIMLKSLDASNSKGSNYAFELDVDRDGKGDFLVLAANPESTDWSVNGVHVYEDTNNTVGDLSPMYPDKNAAADGYETSLFDQGQGKDPDSAWARLSATESNTLEIAVKRSVVGNPEKYLISMWAGTGMLDPALFDLNDHFTHEQAGAADIGLTTYYPIKEVAEIDNSCKMAVGFQPTGKEPGLCEVVVPVVPGETPAICTLTTGYCTQLGESFDAGKCACVPVG